MSQNVPIRNLPSGIPGLDDVLGGGFPELSFNVIAGAPGSGKTTLAHQFVFTNATRESQAIYFSIIGEPPLKMLRYQQQFSFFDAQKVGDSIHFVSLAMEAYAGGLAKVLERIVEEVNRVNPAVVVVDSFRSAMRRAGDARNADLAIEEFVQRLALHLTSCEATTFLLGAFGDGVHDSPVFTVADGVIELGQAVHRNSMVRKLQVVKMRGQGQIPGLQTMRISEHGLSVFPRQLKPGDARVAHPLDDRLKTGVSALDAMLGGGVPRGYSVLVSGPSGSGKTVLANRFIVEGASSGEPGVIAVFEKRPNDYRATTPLHADLDRLVKEKKLDILYLRPLDLSIDETLVAMRDAVRRIGAKRAVIDSVSGLELALAPTFREDFRESLYRMVDALTGLGVTVLSTVALPDDFTELRFSPQDVAFLTDAIIMQRYILIEAELRRAMGVVKVRGSEHSKELRSYEIDAAGRIVVGDALKGFAGLLTGAPRRTA